MSASISNLRYADPHGVLIDMDVTRDGETFRFTYAPDDDAPLTNEVRALLRTGSHAIETYAEPIPDAAVLATPSGRSCAMMSSASRPL